jgi:phosphoserine phosphatase
MNYHYIDYMIKERQREELDACERLRTLRSAGYQFVYVSGFFYLF